MDHGCIEQVGTPTEVYDNPANLFVYQFLGDVSLFHGRNGPSSAGYARPSELEISRAADAPTGAVIATVRFIGATGATVRLELHGEETNQSFEAEIPRDRYQSLNLKIGDSVAVTPRILRVFGEAAPK
jgi:sulfate transport system ATP-binding protein